MRRKLISSVLYSAGIPSEQKTRSKYRTSIRAVLLALCNGNIFLRQYQHDSST
jgi:hypothetical protein